MARWHSCNVLRPGVQSRQLWQFSASGNKFALQREESQPASEPLPDKLVAKDWQTLFQPRLNIAWLAADRVFVRVAQLPKADADETRSMVELQLEKFSPLPVAQIVWSYEVLPHARQDGTGQEFNPHATGELQTVIVIMVSRQHVEEFLGQLEGQGFLADRLELPLVDELRATRVEQSGAWVFPNLGGHEGACMVAWWYDGVLQNLSIIHLPPDDRRAAILQEQLAQATWAGELEGWLTSPPHFRLVADEATAAQWLPLFDLSQQVGIAAPVPAPQLAALTARRVVQNGTATNLMPADFTVRYKQLFIDRLWMRGLGAVLMVYILGVMVYFSFVQVAAYRHGAVQKQVVALGPTYTNTLQLRERLKVLQDTLDLQYAALECYRSVAETLPSELTLSSINFERGRKVMFFGAAGPEDRTKVLEFNAKLIEYSVKNQRLFSKVNSPNVTLQPGQASLNWNFACDLKRTDATD